MILDAASAVISQNRNRKDKRLWTDRKGGSRIVYFRGNDVFEADFITRSIKQYDPECRCHDGRALPHEPSRGPSRIR
jgi:DNA helicase-2/ATP-dependent DNA helicase PcrA